MELLSFNSVQSTARLQLRTSAAGRHTYQVTDIGDVAYPIKLDNSRRGQTPIYTLKQTVQSRPTAFFQTSQRLSYCLREKLTPREGRSEAGTVVLKGQPPFTLKLSLKNLSNNKRVVEEVTVDSHSWPGEPPELPTLMTRANLLLAVGIPSYEFETMGPTLLTIESMEDSSACTETQPDVPKRSIWIDVAESAAVVPFDRKRDYCVGEPISLQLEGIPSWTIRCGDMVFSRLVG